MHHTSMNHTSYIIHHTPTHPHHTPTSPLTPPPPPTHRMHSPPGGRRWSPGTPRAFLSLPHQAQRGKKERGQEGKGEEDMCGGCRTDGDVQQLLYAHNCSTSMCCYCCCCGCCGCCCCCGCCGYIHITACITHPPASSLSLSHTHTHTLTHTHLHPPHTHSPPNLAGQGHIP